jgi:hypothetical protein
VVFFFFQKKKQKALFRFAEEPYRSISRYTTWYNSYHCGSLDKGSFILGTKPGDVLLFPEKEAKSVVPLRGSVF